MGLGSFALWSQTDAVFLCLAVAWFGTAIARIAGTLIDKSYSSMTLIFVGIEVFVGALLFL